MRMAVALLLVAAICGLAYAEAPDISKLPPHPRLWIGGVSTAAGYIDPAKLAERAKARPDDFALLTSTSDVNSQALAAAVSGDKAAIDKVAAKIKTMNVTRGEGMEQAALAFDWIAPSLSEADRKALATHLGDMLPKVEPSLATRFNSLDNNPMRRAMGIGLAALAIADDDPRAAEYFKQANALMEEFISETGDGAKADDMDGRGAYGGGWPEGYDYNRHGSRYAIQYFLGLRSATGVDAFKGSKFWKDTQYFHIYEVLPNGYNILPFQDNDWTFMLRLDREVMLVLAREYKDPHARYYLNHVNTTKDNGAAAFEFLYDEPKEAEHDYSDLPKAHYIPGTGTVYARSGWGPNDTYVAFCASDWYVYHQNNAQNVFAIYRNAPLAVKDGVYNGDVHDHYVNYSIRTIAYNGITVLDPNEKQSGPDSIKEAANDGGQLIQQWHNNPDGLAMWREQARRKTPPMRDIVDWKGFETNDTYTYCAAEAGRAYMPGKVPFFSRQIVFIYPNWVLVFDRVTSGEASFAKQFHLHTPEALEVKGDEAVATTKTANNTKTPGRLFVKSLLPAKAQVEKVEGLAVYGGVSHKGPEPYNGQFLCPVHLQITAPEGKDTFFLTAMYACDATVEKAPESKVTEDTPDKVTVSLDGGKHEVTFNKTGEVGWKLVK
jgi:hypothetical protein